MKLGTLTAALGDLPLDEACGFLAGNGVQMVEIGCGGFPGTAHCDAAELLADQGKRREFLDTVHRHGLEISALSSHGNMDKKKLSARPIWQTRAARRATQSMHGIWQ